MPKPFGPVAACVLQLGLSFFRKKWMYLKVLAWNDTLYINPEIYCFQKKMCCQPLFYTVLPQRNLILQEQNYSMYNLYSIVWNKVPHLFATATASFDSLILIRLFGRQGFQKLRYMHINECSCLFVSLNIHLNIYLLWNNLCYGCFVTK